MNIGLLFFWVGGGGGGGGGGVWGGGGGGEGGWEWEQKKYGKIVRSANKIRIKKIQNYEKVREREEIDFFISLLYV